MLILCVKGQMETCKCVIGFFHEKGKNEVGPTGIWQTVAVIQTESRHQVHVTE